MNKIFCSVAERDVNPLFEVFDGGDFILTSYRDIEEPLARMEIYYEDPSQESAARACLGAALAIVGVKAEIQVTTIPDEDWKLSYRRHFKTEQIGEHLTIRPPWEPEPTDGRLVITLDPGMAFGTGKHETTRACLEYIDACAKKGLSFLDMGCGSGILSIAAAKLGYQPVRGFDVDQEAVTASQENAALNGAHVDYSKYALGGKVRTAWEPADVVAANILGPLLIRFVNEIAPAVRKNLIISGILTELYEAVLAVYLKAGFTEISRKTYGEWTTGLLERKA